jgi:hypothetical protein
MKDASNRYQGCLLGLATGDAQKRCVLSTGGRYNVIVYHYGTSQARE